MTNITHLVWKYIDTDSALKRDLSRGIINKRALALHIKKQTNVKATVDSIISAIRRYHLDAGYEEKFRKASLLISKSKIATKSRIVNVALIKDTDVQKLLPRLFSTVDYARGEVLRIVQAEESIKVMVDEKNLDKVISLFPKPKIIKIHKNLAELNMTVDPEAYKVPGVLSMISTELSSNQINIVEAMSCVPELLWFVEESDILKAHQVLFELGKSMSG